MRTSQIDVEYAMMDTSDGLADALFQIARASNVTIITQEIEGMFAAEDYKLVAAVPKEFAIKIPNIRIIGSVTDFKGYYLQVGNKKYCDHNQLEVFDHFN